MCCSVNNKVNFCSHWILLLICILVCVVTGTGGFLKINSILGLPIIPEITSGQNSMTKHDVMFDLYRRISVLSFLASVVIGSLMIAKKQKK